MRTNELARIGTAEFLRSVVTADADARASISASEVLDAVDDYERIRGAAFRAVPGVMRRRIAQDVTAAALRELAGEYPAIAHACQSAIFTRRR